MGRRSDFIRRKFLGAKRYCQEPPDNFAIAGKHALWLTVGWFMSLKETIKAAFAPVPYPGDTNITRCPYHCKPCEEIADYFKGKGWEGHSVEDLRDHHTALSLFTPEAFHYFLPAFMLASVESYDNTDILPDSIRFHFEFSLEHRDHFLVRLTKFSDEQRKVIVEFLRFMESKGAGSSEDAISLLQESKSAS